MPEHNLDHMSIKQRKHYLSYRRNKPEKKDVPSLIDKLKKMSVSVPHPK